MLCIKCKTDLPEGAVFCPACGKKQIQERKHRKHANGTGSISKPSGNRAKPWAARRNGILIGTCSTRAEAQEALERVTDATINDKYNLTFAQIYKAWKQAIANKEQKLIDGFEGNRDQRNFAKREFKALLEEIGRPGLTMYCCRHTYITNAARNRVDQRALQQMVGHMDKETTKLYTHLNIDDLRAESRKIKTSAVCNKCVTESEVQNKSMQKNFLK